MMFNFSGIWRGYLVWWAGNSTDSGIIRVHGKPYNNRALRIGIGSRM